MKLKLLFALLLVVMVFPTAFAQKQSKPKGANQAEQSTPRRIVYDMAEGDTARHSGLMRQLNNIKRGWPDAQIEVVVHGKSLNLLVTDKTTQRASIKALQEKGVVFVACENTMRMQKVEKNQLLPGVTTVPMAIGEIIMKQDEGWGYIKF
ncbi:DsrE family protein [Pontibacter sp. JH31]|uniref:DsrE family protein n=1 Tax=Pontibacter aquaedesilientis TaxID=2766980 RepID=A0ABR7XDT2_9BACT|nr:DsrE family protein [Pontibacter aquaedesilientis]MBD1396456.1 DsrE family protein [Pontibacter aquaedesilientis]